MLETSLTSPADLQQEPGLEHLNALDRIVAFTQAARDRMDLTGPQAWTDAGLHWLAARLGHFPVPEGWPPPGGLRAAWGEIESLMRRLLGRVIVFFSDGTVRHIEAAHLGIMWSALSGKLLTLIEPRPPAATPTSGPDRMPGVSAWTALRLARDPAEATPLQKGRKRYDKLELRMNDLVARWWEEAGGAAFKWRIHKTVEKWDQEPPRGASDPFSELLALCQHTGNRGPIRWVAEYLGYRLLPAPRRIDSTADHPPNPVRICAALHELAAAAAHANLDPGPHTTETVKSAWHRADALLAEV